MEFDCKGCKRLTGVPFGMEAPPHRLCWICSTEEVTNLQGKLQETKLQNDELKRRLNLILCGKEKPDGEWTPELRAAHAARFEFIDAMGQGHYSRTDAAWHLKTYTKRILEESNRLNGELRQALTNTAHFVHLERHAGVPLEKCLAPVCLQSAKALGLADKRNDETRWCTCVPEKDGTHQPDCVGEDQMKLRVNVRFGKKRTTIKPGLYSVADLKKRGDFPTGYTLAVAVTCDKLLELQDDGHFEITEETTFEGYPKDGVNL